MIGSIVTQCVRAFGVAVLVMASWTVATAESARVVTVDGVGAVIGDVAAARDEAIRDALRLAVEQALGVSVQGRTLMVDFQVVEDRVLGRSEGFVREYRVLREARDADLYRVTVEAHVDTEVMIDDLEGFGALLRLTLGNPRVLVLTLADDGDPSVEAPVTQALTDHLVERQFLVVSAEQLGVLHGLAADVSVAESARLARTVDADLVIRATVRTESVGARPTATSSINSVRADVSVQAILTRTSQIIASRTANLTRASVSEDIARREAAAGATEALLTPFTLATISVLNTTLGGEGTQRSVQVVVEGIDDFEAALALRDALSGVRGVLSLQQRSFGDGRATFDVQGSATTDDLAVRLLAHDDVPLQVTFLDAQRLVVTVRP